jgi:hypothetical protein
MDEGGGTIQEYSFKRGYNPDRARILIVLKDCFPCTIMEDDEKFRLSYGAMKEMTVWVDDKRLFVDTKSNVDVNDDVILDTNKRFRDFLDKTTGYTTKQRRDIAKRESQKA